MGYLRFFLFLLPLLCLQVMVKLELNLPWKPVLAWPWGVSYLIDPDTFLVTKHTESWDIEPWKGVGQIFRRPTVKVGNKLEISK
ncbi:hypothetical protein ACHAW5_008290 [Stephanodiscus triporus]|uniref:Uncharacterized protein n=1 Tax=Stephanodiscus triporus TaxID=2934178 RepID=A0ABD3PBY3_9STRA